MNETTFASSAFVRSDYSKRQTAKSCIHSTRFILDRSSISRYSAIGKYRTRRAVKQDALSEIQDGNQVGTEHGT